MIVGNGDGALCGDIFTSNNNFDDNGTSFDIYCTVSDTCYIRFQSSGACSNLILHCKHHNDWITDTPSAAPSMLPTVAPTFYSTIFPIAIPTTSRISPRIYI